MSYLFESPLFRYRRLALDDESFYVGLYTCPQTTQFIGGPLPLAKAKQVFSYALKKSQREQPKYLILSCEHKELGTMIGITGITQIKYQSQTADLGIILNPEFHGQKLSKSIYSDTIRFVKNTLSVRTLYSRMDPRNQAMEKITLSLGFSQVGSDPSTNQLTYSINL